MINYPNKLIKLYLKCPDVDLIELIMKDNVRNKQNEIELIKSYSELIATEVKKIKKEQNKFKKDIDYDLIKIYKKNIIEFWKKLGNDLNDVNSSIHNYEQGTEIHDAEGIVKDLNNILEKNGLIEDYKISFY